MDIFDWLITSEDSLPTNSREFLSLPQSPTVKGPSSDLTDYESRIRRLIVRLYSNQSVRDPEDVARGNPVGRERSPLKETRHTPEGTADSAISQSPIMSGAAPYSYTSVPFFSADDMTLDLSTEGEGVLPVGGVSTGGQENVPSAFRANWPPPPMDLTAAGDDNLYSFTDSSANPDPPKPHPQGGRLVTSSFGVSPEALVSMRSLSRGQSSTSMTDSKENTPVPEDNVGGASNNVGGASESDGKAESDVTKVKPRDDVRPSDDTDGVFTTQIAPGPEQTSVVTQITSDPHHDFRVPLESLSRLDSDVETSSVVSLQQLAEISDGNYDDDNATPTTDDQESNHEELDSDLLTVPPLRLNADVLPSHMQLSPTTPPISEPRPSPVKRPSSNQLPVTMRPQLPWKPNEEHFDDKSSGKDTKSSSPHDHLFSGQAAEDDQPSKALGDGPLKDHVLEDRDQDKPLKSRPFQGSEDKPLDEAVEDELLREQLAQALEEKANLEGQLESVLEECKAAMNERAVLQSKLARAEAEKTTMTETLERERSRPLNLSLKDDSNVEEIKQALKEAREVNKEEKKRVSDLKKELSKEKLASSRLQGEITDVSKTLTDKEATISELQDQLNQQQSEHEQKGGEVEEMECKLSALEASYGALEETKAWLHDQLQEALKEKQQLQEDLREVKTNAMTQGIRADQLVKENSSFQQQIGELQQGILLDKARLVSELEAIEADVLSREDSYSRLVAEKAQLEDIARMKSEALEHLNCDLARSQVENEELQKKIEDLESQNVSLSRKVNEAVREKDRLADRVQVHEKNMAAKDRELKEMEQLKNSLHDKWRQAEAALVSKDGTMQGLNDAKEILTQELAMVKTDRDSLDSELGEAKREMAKLETQLAETEGELQDKMAQLASLTQAQGGLQAENEELVSSLEEKERELEERTKELQSVEAQSSDLIGQFKSLQGQFQNIATQRGDVSEEIAEKDRVISHLASEKEKGDGELVSLREQNHDLERQVAELEEERARLQGEVEVASSTNNEELLKALQDKSQLQAELNSLKLTNQRELAKSEARLRRMETDVKSAKRDASKAQKDLQAAITEKAEEMNRLKDALAKSEREGREGRNKLERALRENETMLTSASTPSSSEEIERLQARCQQLAEVNTSLTDQLRQEMNQKTEVERAGSVVAAMLKENAEKERKKQQKQIRELSLEVEKLKGRLTGMTSAKAAMKDHAVSVEAELARKESSLVRLSAQVQKILEEKEMEDEAFKDQLSDLEQQLHESRKTAESANETSAVDKRRIAELEHELSVRDCEVEELNKTVQQVRHRELGSLKDKVLSLEEERRKNQQELGEMRSQLVAARTACDRATRELSDKETQLSIFKQEMEMARGKSQQAEDEARRLRERIEQLTDKPRPFETSLSTIEGEETDKVSVSGGSQSSDVDRVERLNDTLRESSQQTIEQLVGYNTLYRAHLKEMGARLEQARRQGQETAEIKKSGEINVLRKELGSKSRTITGLQSCLLSLKDDMDKLHHSMDQHSATVRDSFKSTKQIESRIKNLKKSQHTN